MAPSVPCGPGGPDGTVTVIGAPGGKGEAGVNRRAFGAVCVHWPGHDGSSCGAAAEGLSGAEKVTSIGAEGDTSLVPGTGARAVTDSGAGAVVGGGAGRAVRGALVGDAPTVRVVCRVVAVQTPATRTTTTTAPSVT